MINFLDLPEREQKPRSTGITIAMDTGHGKYQIEDVMETCSNCIDYVKLGWGTSVVTKNLHAKIDVYKKWEVPLYLGGTFLEIAFLQNKINDFEALITEMGIGIIEVSDGVIPIERSEKLKLIERFSKRFQVLSEYGSKTSKTITPPHLWVMHMKEEIDAGAWKVIGEGRESGTSGMYRSNTELRTGLIEEIVYSINHEDIIWETPRKEQQTWFVKRFGANVNLANIAMNSVISLETIRLGLRADTLLHHHGK